MEKHIEDLKYIANNYRMLEKSISSQLEMLVTHPTVTGSNRELIWMELFKGIIPHKFSIERSVFIIDSTGKVSNEVDLAIFDEQYTPYIFRHGNLKYIPIEAVAVVIECKSSSLDKDSLKSWCGSIDQLNTSGNSIVRLANFIHHLDAKNTRDSTQTGTRPIKILCNQYTGDAKTYLKDSLFDLVMQHKEEKLMLLMPEKKGLGYWYEELNHKTANDWPENSKELKCKFPEDKEKCSLEEYQVKAGEDVNTILSLVFILNQLLTLINNPLFFPHLSYVKLFNAVEEKTIPKEKGE